MLRALAIGLAVLALSCHREDASADDAPVKKIKKQKRVVRTVCPFPAEQPIVIKVEIAARCDVAIDRDVRVAKGGSIVVGPGSRLAFAARAGMSFEGGSIVARGSKDEPVVFTSDTPDPGSWAGLNFPQPFAPAGMTIDPVESSLENTIIEFAGGAGRALTAGLVLTARDTSSLKLDQVTFRSNASRGLYVYDVGVFRGGDGLVFRKNGGFSFDGDPDVLAKIKGLDTDEPIRLGGIVTGPLVIPRVPAIQVRRLIVDSSAADGASVTFPEGVRVLVEPHGEIRIGTGVSGRACGFVAHKVTFASSQSSPRAGDWNSIAVYSDCKVDIQDSVIADAERGLQLPPLASHVTLERTTFKNLTGPAIEAYGCTPFRDPAKGNSASTKLCEEIYGLGLSGIGAGGSGISPR